MPPLWDLMTMTMRAMRAMPRVYRCHMCIDIATCACTHMCISCECVRRIYIDLFSEPPYIVNIEIM